MNNTNNLNSSHLELLLALVEQSSFSDAAQALGITQSAVSHGLARLETDLGFLLVERGRRGVTLTQAGHAILPHAREVVARLSAIRQIAALSDGAARGKLRLGVITPFPALRLMEIIAAFQAAHPQVELLIIEEGGMGGKNLVAEGLVDVGMVPHPAPSLESHLFWADELCAVVAANHGLASQATVSLPDLFDSPLIVPPMGRDVVWEAMRRRDGVSGRPPVRHLVGDTHLLLSMARRGLGVGLLPRTTFAELAPQEVVALPVSPPLSLRLGLAVRSWEGASPVARRFVESVVGSAPPGSAHAKPAQGQVR